MKEARAAAGQAGRMPGHRKVHLVSVGFEVARIVEPIARIGADVVVIIRAPSEESPYAEFVNEVKRQLRARIKPLELREGRVNLFDFHELVGEVGRLISSEVAEGNEVLVNISTGSRLFDAAALVASMMFGATPYYAPVAEYLLQPKDFYRDGTPVGTITKVKDPVTVHRFEIPPPPMDLVRCMSTLERMEEDEGGLNQTGLMRRLRREGMITVKEGDARAEDQRALVECRRRYVLPLVDRGWIAVEGRRRSARLKITDLGRRMVTMFGSVTSQGSARAS